MQAPLGPQLGPWKRTSSWSLNCSRTWAAQRTTSEGASSSSFGTRARLVLDPLAETRDFFEFSRFADLFSINGWCRPERFISSASVESGSAHLGFRRIPRLVGVQPLQRGYGVTKRVTANLRNLAWRWGFWVITSTHTHYYHDRFIFHFANINFWIIRKSLPILNFFFNESNFAE